jgi:hypothetical protein
MSPFNVPRPVNPTLPLCVAGMPVTTIFFWGAASCLHAEKITAQRIAAIKSLLKYCFSFCSPWDIIGIIFKV